MSGEARNGPGGLVREAGRGYPEGMKDRYLIAPPDNRKPVGKARPVSLRRKILPEDKPLTMRQKRFVEELVTNDGAITLREAAERAGYSPKNSSNAAYLMTNPRISPHIVLAIKQMRDEQEEKYGINKFRHLRDLQRIRDAAMNAGQYGAAVQAEHKRGLADGNIYISKSEIRHGTIDSMSKEEVIRALKEIEHKNGGRIIDLSAQRGADEDGEEGEAPAPGGGGLGDVPEGIEDGEMDCDAAGDLGASGRSRSAGLGSDGAPRPGRAEIDPEPPA